MGQQGQILWLLQFLERVELLCKTLQSPSLLMSIPWLWLLWFLAPHQRWEEAWWQSWVGLNPANVQSPSNIWWNWYNGKSADCCCPCAESLDKILAACHAHVCKMHVGLTNRYWSLQCALRASWASYDCRALIYRSLMTPVWYKCLFKAILNTAPSWLAVGSGFGSNPKLVSIQSQDTGLAVELLSAGSTAFTFTSPPSGGLPGSTLILKVNNATQNFTVQYSEAATPEVTEVLGDYPILGGQLQLPASSAASLTLTGLGFGNGSARVGTDH